MKKLLAILLALIMVFALTACGKKPPASSGDNRLMDDLQDSIGGKDGEAQEEQGGIESENGGSSVLVNDSVSIYSEAYKNYEAVYSAMSAAYDEILETHNAKIEADSDNYWDDPNHFTDYVTNFVNIPIALTATFGDSHYEAGVAALFEMLEMKDGQVEEIDDSNYRVTYTGIYNDMETWESFADVSYENLCGFDAGTGALYFREYVTVNGDKKLDNFIEFVPLGGGRYALQSEYERGIVELLNGKAVSYEYAAYKIPFDAEADSIFPKASGADTAWITAGSEMYQHITLDSKSLHIWADEITEGILAMPERDIMIDR